MKKQKILDLNPSIHQLYHSFETRKLHDLLFHQTKIFESAYSQNVQMIFEKARLGKLAFQNESQLLDILNSKFEIDLCRLSVSGNSFYLVFMF